MSSMLPQMFPFLQGNSDYIEMLVFFLLATCTSGQNSCVSCHPSNITCNTCHTGYTKDVNGVCRGIVFAYTFFYSSGSYLYITVLDIFSVTSLGSFRVFDVNEICSLGELLLC